MKRKRPDQVSSSFAPLSAVFWCAELWFCSSFGNESSLDMNPEILNTTQARSSSLRAGRGWLLAYDATSALKCLCHAMCWLCGWCSADGVAATFAAAARPAAGTDPMTTGCWSAATRSWQEWSDLRRKKKNLTFFRALWNEFYFPPCSALFFPPQNKYLIYTHTHSSIITVGHETVPLSGLNWW